ncbi:MAG: FMN-binding negative transcriptional regulator [Sneathiella sp.]|nr:FMN-binding negative transcriptional regulator [Sneathiella sp.]
MYTPKHFLAPAQETLLKILPDASFAILVTVDGDGVPVVSHLPVRYDPAEGEFGIVRGHLARANPHCKLLGERPSLVIFNGPHIYVSPRDYASNVNVPTWNYVAVHAHGQAQILEDPADVRRVLDGLTEDNEKYRENPWSLDEFEEKRAAAMMKAIVAFQIPISRLDAKAKLGQNKSVEDQAALKKAASGTDIESWQIEGTSL